MGIRGIDDVYSDQLSAVEGYCKTCKRPAVKVTQGEQVGRCYHPARVFPPGDPDGVCPVLLPIRGLEDFDNVKSFDIPEEEFVAI